MPRIIVSSEEVFALAKEKHGDKYSYAKSIYKTMDTNMLVTCPIHGDFYITPRKLLSGRGCKECEKEEERKKKEKELLAKVKELHKDKKWSYEKFKFKTMRDKVTVTCHEIGSNGKEHGDFEIRLDHLLSGHGCKKCRDDARRKTTEQFIEEAEAIHGVGRYDYSHAEYENVKTDMPIICHEQDEYGNVHGVFWQSADDHVIHQHGCPKCYGTPKKTREQFIEEAETVHGKGTYDYSLTDYFDNKTKVKIICHEKDANGKEHGIFLKRPDHHISGKQGCPICKQSRMETETNTILKKFGIAFEEQKTFNWLGKLRLDFYLTDLNIAIECQGLQHFEPVEFFGGEESFNEIIERDRRKKQLCEANNVPLFYIRYDENVEERLQQILSEFVDVTTYHQTTVNETTVTEQQV